MDPFDLGIKARLTFEFLVAFLGNAGFKWARRVESFGLFNDSSMTRFANQLISLNVQAFKSGCARRRWRAEMQCGGGAHSAFVTKDDAQACDQTVAPSRARSRKAPRKRAARRSMGSGVGVKLSTPVLLRFAV